MADKNLPTWPLGYVGYWGSDRVTEAIHQVSGNSNDFLNIPVPFTFFFSWVYCFSLKMHCCAIMNNSVIVL